MIWIRADNYIHEHNQVLDLFYYSDNHFVSVVLDCCVVVLFSRCAVALSWWLLLNEIVHGFNRFITHHFK